MSKNIWAAEWSGCWPNLCSGYWTLYKNDKKVNVKIPFEEDCADTFGEYMSWHFEDWEEVFEPYGDGLHCDAWIVKNENWLKTIADENEFEDIYAAFQAEDFRPGSCGGCI